MAFTRLAVLFPTSVALLYWKGVRPAGCIASIVFGEALVFWHFGAGGLPDALTRGFDPSTPIVAIGAVVLVVVSRLVPRR